MVSTLTQQHRAQQLLLRKATVTQVGKLWPALQADDLDGSFPEFAARMSTLVARNRQTSAGLAAAYFRRFRTEAGVRGEGRPVLASKLNVDQFTTSLRVTSVVAVKKASAGGVAFDVAMGNGLTQTTGAMGRLVLNAGRSTVLDSVYADPAAAGWQRVLGGGGCDFCQMLAGRGAVYKGQESADFESHDHCGCSAEAVYG